MTVFVIVVFIVVAVIIMAFSVNGSNDDVDSQVKPSPKFNSFVNINEEVVQVSAEVMNKAYDKSAGRWCDHCDMNGSHHTDRHNAFAQAINVKK